MKNLKKLMAVLLTVVMALGMVSTAFAAEGPSITVPNKTGHTYEIYQIFTGTYDAATNKLSDIKWGLNGKVEQGAEVEKDDLDALTKANADGATDTSKLAVIKNYVTLSNPYMADVAAGKKVTVDPGYYLIKDKDDTLGDKVSEAYTLYIVEVVGNVELEAKGEVPTVKKEILDPNAMKENEASIGDTINYQVTGTLPSNIADYATYFYKFTDTMSAGLTYNKDMTVKIGGVDVTKYFYINPANSNNVTDPTGETSIEVSIVDLLALSKLDDVGVSITASSEIVLTYSATLNTNAEIAGEGNPNEIDLEYSNNPNDSGDPTTKPPGENPNKPETTHPTGETPKSKVITYTTELTILKTDETGAILPGAEFTLTGDGVNIVLVTEEVFTPSADGTYYKLKDGTYTTEAPKEDQTDDDGNIIFNNNYADYDSVSQTYVKDTQTVVKEADATSSSVVGRVNDKGLVTFTGLGKGTYTLSESKTPAGYNTMKDMEFIITFNPGDPDDNTKNYSFTVSAGSGIDADGDNTFSATIKNFAGSTLPETGGMGTTLLYAVGGVLVVGAGILLITKKRMGGVM